MDMNSGAAAAAIAPKTVEDISDCRSSRHRTNCVQALHTMLLAAIDPNAFSSAAVLKSSHEFRDATTITRCLLWRRPGA